MNRVRIVTVAAGAIALAALGAAQIGGTYDLSRNTAEASGALSANGSYTLFSSVHQPIASLSTPSVSGSYSLTSGFLSAAQPESIGDVWSIK